MDLLKLLYDGVSWFEGSREFFIPGIFVLLLYFGLRKRAELGWHAIQNTSATIVLAGANLVLVVLFFREINTFAQAAYDSLGIPTIDPKAWDRTPLWLLAILGIVARDFADYAIHRLMHTKWLWPAHAAHHSDTYVNAFTTYRVHFFEAVLMSLSYIVLLTWLQMPEAIPFVAVLGAAHNMYVHLNVDWDHGPFKYVIASPAFHRWHHADTPAAYGKNLANILPVYDLLFGTYYMPGRCEHPMGALKSGIEDKNPVAILLYPFQAWGRLLRDAGAAALARWHDRRREARPSPTDAMPGE